MKSLNFEFLRPTHAELADLGGFAEACAHSDPSSALVKLVTAEALVTAQGLPNLELSARVSEEPARLVASAPRA